MRLVALALSVLVAGCGDTIIQFPASADVTEDAWEPDATEDTRPPGDTGEVLAPKWVPPADYCDTTEIPLSSVCGNIYEFATADELQAVEDYATTNDWCTEETRGHFFAAGRCFVCTRSNISGGEIVMHGLPCSTSLCMQSKCVGTQPPWP